MPDTPYASPLTFRTEVTPQLYLASGALTFLGLVFTGYYLTTSEAGFAGLLAALVGVFMLYVAWVNFWAVSGGYPHLVLVGHRLSVRSSDAVRRDLDLSTLGEASIATISGRRRGTELHLAFRPSPASRPPRRFAAPQLAGFAETILLNGYVGTKRDRADEILRVIEARRREPVTSIPPARRRNPAARMRLIATASLFAALWVALVWWRLLP